MNTFLILLVAVLMALTVFTLVRGIVAFLASAKADIDRPEGSGPSPHQLLQNKLMYRRIMFQAAAIVVVTVILFAARK